MAVPSDYAARTAAWNQQYDQQQADETAKAQQEQQKGQEPSLLQRFASIGRVSFPMLDTAISAAEHFGDTAFGKSKLGRADRDVASGLTSGAVNTADFVHSVADHVVNVAKGSTTPNDELVEEQISGDSRAAEDRMRSLEDQPASSPIWDHAKAAVLDFRDAVAVKDPTLSDNLLQSVAQLAGPFAAYSRAFAGYQGIANTVAAGAVTDATALAPNAPRTADLIALGQHTEGLFGKALRAMGPYGLNAYINFLAADPNDSEAEARFKNVLDGMSANLIAVPLMHAVGTTLKYTALGTRYMVENGVGSAGDLGPKPLSMQEGKVGFHGTPNAPFSEFNNSRIGSGQGAQSFGYGHYIAEAEGTGETYQKSLSGRMNNSAALSDAQSAVKQFGGDKVRAYQELTEMAAKEKDAGLRMRMQNSARIIKSGNVDNGKGSLLRVEIDDKHIANMVDLDKPLAKQPEVLSKIPMKDQKILQQVLDDHGQDLQLGELTGNEFRQLIERAHNENYLPTPEGKLYGSATGNAAADASEYLSSRGIPGHKYLDRVSRVTGEGTRNYVVFDGKHIKVLGKK